MMFPQILKQLRTEQNISQKELADLLGYSRTTISAYEIGRNEPSFEDLLKIATAFHVSVDYLLSGTQTKATPQKAKPLSDEQKKLIGAIRELSTEELAKVIDYIDFVKTKRNP